MYLLIIFALCILLAVSLKMFWDLKGDFRKYVPIRDLDREILTRQELANSLERQVSEAQTKVDNLNKEISILNDDHDLLSAGFYKPKYEFSRSSEYSDRLDEIRQKQKELIKNKAAIVCDTQWEVSGSKAEGKKMIDRIIRLGLSAFNVQCDNEILDVRFDNIDRSEIKLNKIRENVNKLLEPNRCKITDEFFRLKLEELRLSYEYEEKLYKEKEEQKALREQMKEEDRARREAERAQADAEREEKRYADALEKARRELASKSDAEREQYSLKISTLEEQLRIAMENKERAKSMAEQTRKGHVYIISNIGSFGEHVYKIEMTRRLDPLDRIWELGDASVPFDFDIHALIQSEDAPGLERKLHETFSNHRVNRVNERKEFFRVTLTEIAKACKKHHNMEFKLTLVAEAKEYRQTTAMIETENKSEAPKEAVEA